MIYKITKVTLIRRHEGRQDECYSFKTQDETNNLKEYKGSLIKRFQATSVHLNYTEIC